MQQETENNENKTMNILKTICQGKIILLLNVLNASLLLRGIKSYRKISKCTKKKCSKQVCNVLVAIFTEREFKCFPVSSLNVFQ